MGSGRGPSFMKSGVFRAVLGVVLRAVSCRDSVSLEGAGVAAPFAVSCRDSVSLAGAGSLRDDRSVSDFGADFKFSDLGPAFAEVSEGRPVVAVGGRTTFPHWGQGRSLKSCSGAI